MKREVVDSGFIVETQKGFQAGSYTYGYKTRNELWTFRQSLLACIKRVSLTPEYSYIRTLNIGNKNAPFYSGRTFGRGLSWQIIVFCQTFSGGPFWKGCWKLYEMIPSHNILRNHHQQVNWKREDKDFPLFSYLPAG